MLGPGIELEKAGKLKKYLKGSEFPEKVNELVTQFSTEAFQRIDCLSCGNCCKSNPPLMEDEDISRIAKHLKISKKAFKRKYILEDINGEQSMINVPCVFLEEDNSCSIYEIRPKACAAYPHLDEGQFFKLKGLHAKNVFSCPIAYNVIGRINKISQNQ